MSAKVLRQANNGNILLFFCPGCECGHEITVNGVRNSCGATWSWNGSLEKPTFNPSLHIVGACHSFVRDGMIQFLPDCLHKLKGQTVPLPDWESV